MTVLALVWVWVGACSFLYGLLRAFCLVDDGEGVWLVAIRDDYSAEKAEDSPFYVEVKFSIGEIDGRSYDEVFNALAEALVESPYGPSGSGSRYGLERARYRRVRSPQ